jgi:hypothetical protein
MNLEKNIQEIQAAIEAGQFANEAAISQGIVLRLLSALSWPCYDTKVVSPEYSLEGQRVDFALCHPPGKPIVFIEVKQIGRQSDDSERQLFQYAFHTGVPLAILTDGQEWHFFLPAEQGNYGERKVYKLDLLERKVGECANRLMRYLEYQAVVSGTAIEAARDDYRSVARSRLIEATLPKAWKKLLEEKDDLLVELLADRAASLCGYKPGSDTVARFLEENLTLKEASPTESPRAEKLLRSRNEIVSPLGEVPEYVKTYREMLKNPDSLPSRMKKYIDQVGSITWRNLKRECVQRLGCKSQTSGSIGASLRVLELDGHVKITGRGEGRKVLSARTLK